MNHAPLFGVALTALLAATPAAAQSLTGNVGAAAITQGERAVEFRTGINEEGDAASRLHVDHAFTDWYQLRLVGAFARPDGEGWDYRGLTIENWFQWREEQPDGSSFNGGLRFAYTFKDGGGPDEAAVRLTLTDRIADGWEWRANLIAEVETGTGSEGGVGLESRAQLTRKVSMALLGANTRLGGEVFSEYGNTKDIPAFKDQAHQVGPVLKFDWENGVFLQTAMRFGLTDATDDHMAKLFIGRAF